SQFGFYLDDEGTLEGPDCIAMDMDWIFVTPRGEPTLDLRATRELWFDTDTVDDEQRQRRSTDVQVLITATGNSKKCLLKVLHTQKADLGWNLEGKAHAGGRRLVVTHSSFSGKA